MLGDVAHDDASYTGDTGESPLTLQYYRNKMEEFQAVLQALDDAYSSASETVFLLTDPRRLDAPTDDPDTANAVQELQNLMTEYEGQKTPLVLAADTLNAVSSAANAAGVRFPVLQIPSGLGMGPLAIAGAAAAVAVAVGLIVWGREWIARVYNAQAAAAASQAALAAAAQISDPALRDQTVAAIATTQSAIATQIATTQAALDKANNPLGQIASSVKWVALVALAYFGYRAYEQFSKGK